MKIVFITRAKALNDEKKKDSFRKWIHVFVGNKQIVKTYIISDQLSKDSLKLNDDRIEFIVPAADPTTTTSMNLAIAMLQGMDAFMVVSKEVKISQKAIKKLISETKNHKNRLVTGCKFRLTDKNLNHELEEYYKNKGSIAYQVPWNTCAIWRIDLFKKYVKKFDEITTGDKFDPINVCIDNVCQSTDHKGMEDGLAIAKAATLCGTDVKFKLLNQPLVLWDIEMAHGKVTDHRKKLARKEMVLRNFMAVRDYSVDDLLKAKDK